MTNAHASWFFGLAAAGLLASAPAQVVPDRATLHAILGSNYTHEGFEALPPSFAGLSRQGCLEGLLDACRGAGVGVGAITGAAVGDAAVASAPHHQDGQAIVGV